MHWIIFHLMLFHLRRCAVSLRDTALPRDMGKVLGQPLFCTLDPLSWGQDAQARGQVRQTSRGSASNEHLQWDPGLQGGPHPVGCCDPPGAPATGLRCCSLPQGPSRIPAGSTSCSQPVTTATRSCSPPAAGCTRGQMTGGRFWTASGPTELG